MLSLLSAVRVRHSEHQTSTSRTNCCNNQCNFYNEHPLWFNSLLIFLLTVSTSVTLFLLLSVFHQNLRPTSFSVNRFVFSDVWRQETRHTLHERTSNFRESWFKLNWAERFRTTLNDVCRVSAFCSNESKHVHDCTLCCVITLWIYTHLAHNEFYNNWGAARGLFTFTLVCLPLFYSMPVLFSCCLSSFVFARPGLYLAKGD